MNATHRTGILLATATAAVSGVAVYVNGIGVREVGDATLYTTMKNLVAAVVLLAVAGVVAGRREQRPEQRPEPQATGRRWAPAVVAIVGGSVPFVLFFEGLARADSVDAAFLHKTLVVWVALLAGPVLGERLAGRHVVALGLLLVGWLGLAGGVPSVGWGLGEAMILGATLLWAVEVVVARRLLASTSWSGLAAWRMAGGVVLLLGWTVVTGRTAALVAAGTTAWGWALLTGVLLSAYVGTWYAALQRAPALDVTAVLVGAAVLTALLRAGIDGVAIGADLPWLVLLGAGAAVAGVSGARAARRPVPAAPPS